MPKKKLKAKKNRGTKNYKKKFKNKNIIYYSISIILIIIFSILFLYVVFLFPKILSQKIFNDIIKIYSPVIIEDSKEFKILKLTEKPDIKTNQLVYNEIYNKYGLEVNFEKISTTEEKGINKISFYKNNKIYSDLVSIYLYWDENILENEIKKEITEDSIVSESKKIPVIKEKNNIQNDEKVKENNEIKNFKINYNKKEKEEINLKQNNIQVIKKEKPKNRYKIAIIIDDVGYNYKTTYDFLALNIPLTFAIIPDMPLSKKFYSLIEKYNYEAILHIPMEPEKGKNYVEKNAILTEMNDNAIREKIKKFLNDYPNIIGANNHMGSKAIKDSRVMKIVFEELAKNNKLWVDSMTSYSTISKEIAKIYDLSYYKRDVFLDNNKDINSIRQSFDRLIKEAKKNDYAIGIGHIQSSNLPLVIKEYYEKRDQLDIEFVFLNQLK